MAARTLIDALLLEMPQYRLTTGDPEQDALHIRQDAYSIQTSSSIEGPPWRLDGTAFAILQDGRKKTFHSYGEMTAADVDALTRAQQEYDHALTINAIRPVSWFTIKKQLESKYERELQALEQEAKQKADQWWHGESSKLSLTHMPRVQSLVTGINPSRLIPHIAHLKYAWIKSDDDPSESAETLASFVEQRAPGEALIKLEQSGSRTGQSHPTSSSVYVLANAEQWADLKRRITLVNRERVARKLS